MVDAREALRGSRKACPMVRMTRLLKRCPSVVRRTFRSGHGSKNQRLVEARARCGAHDAEAHVTAHRVRQLGSLSHLYPPGPAKHESALLCRRLRSDEAHRCEE